jgi:hypothetical protein
MSLHRKFDMDIFFALSGSEMYTRDMDDRFISAWLSIRQASHSYEVSSSALEGKPIIEFHKKDIIGIDIS